MVSPALLALKTAYTWKEFNILKSTSLKIAQFSAWSVISIGTLTLIGWLFNLTLFKSVIDGLVPLKPNAAVEFIFAGLFIIILTSETTEPSGKRLSKSVTSLVLTVIMIIALLTMFEYLSEIDLGIDQFLFSDTSILSVHPGRMAPNAVLLFIIAGSSLFLISSPKPIKNKGLISGILGLVITSAGFFSIVDYPWFGSENLIGKFNPMAITAALAFIILGAGIFFLSLNVEQTTWSLKKNITIGFICGMVLMIGMDVYSDLSIVNLQDSAQMIIHTHEVEYHISQLSNALQDIEINRQIYLLTGNKKYRDISKNNWSSINSELETFRKLTSDNPNQQARTLQLTELLNKQLAFLYRTFASYESMGNAMEANQAFFNERNEILTKIRKLLVDADNEEKQLLSVRESDANAISKRTFFLVPLGSFASTGILVWIFMLLNSEVSERLRSESALKKSEGQHSKLNEELNRSNQELEQFAYVASHDLQEPLRMIASFTQLLERKYKDDLDDDAREFIKYAVDGATRMQRLINDLLDYSRVTTRGKPLVKVDLADILGMAIANLHTRILESCAMVVNDNLPFVKGDETQLMRVFQNLIDNAIKFRGKETPHITITSEIEKNNVIIAVHDNGIGIDMKYKERIFIIFQRLHSASVYPGTGIGLAVCKKIIERHGGKIWFESVPGKGTTFKFSLKLV